MTSWRVWLGRKVFGSLAKWLNKPQAGSLCHFFLVSKLPFGNEKKWKWCAVRTLQGDSRRQSLTFADCYFTEKP